MHLDDESIILLSKELYKFPDLEKLLLSNNRISDVGIKCLSDNISTITKLKYLDIENNNIKYDGIKSLFMNIGIEKVKFDLCKDLLVDVSIPELLKYIRCYNFDELLGIKLSNLEIDDDFLEAFINLRSNELKEIESLDLSSIFFTLLIIIDNNITCKGLDSITRNLSSFVSLIKLHLFGNPIGDGGIIQILPHIKYFIPNIYFVSIYIYINN